MAHPLQSPDYQYNPNNLPWRKLLWVKQNYPDNYVDSTFLDELQKNVNVQNYDYWDMVYKSGVITQHISSVVIFIAVFIYLQMGTLVANQLIWAGSLMTGVGYVFWDSVMIPKTTPNLHFDRNTIFFFATLLGLSPILKTLTSQTSDDTIWALTCCCFLTNILFHAYGSQSHARVKQVWGVGIPGSLSTNAAIFASVLLASRFDTNLAVFGLLSFAVEWFALFPIFQSYLQDMSSKAQVALTAIMLLVTVLLYVRISKAVAFLYVLGFCFITFICPRWLIFIQKYKNEIHGPWDEARPRLQRSRKNMYRKRVN
ncbi:phosphatidylinositol N-acetylglucosaminyltransferase subunit C [Dichotomocladium elegans]|nr:phosphatidylinositol N-acetylglucosaminyltransferase subunit C [Dichotomocladium elegans]